MIKKQKVNHIISNRSLINIDTITTLYTNYPDDFIYWCQQNRINYPSIKSANGFALACMLHNQNSYFKREECDKIMAKFNFKTNDSIQLFNKTDQWGLYSSKERGIYYIPIPYKLSPKKDMRMNFTYNGTETEKNSKIDLIKQNIKEDYLDIPNNQWQLGHKNPNSGDNSNNNLVLQPPIQAKYRDNFIFIDTLTKIPTPEKFINDDKNNKSYYTTEQQKILYNYLHSKFDNMNL
tara:strand:+ start:7238 stop:7942 length:705 start_codon:yes stop_codon:yes gene_type:complete